jgi:hypothetical protein
MLKDLEFTEKHKYLMRCYSYGKILTVYLFFIFFYIQYFISCILKISNNTYYLLKHKYIYSKYIVLNIKIRVNLFLTPGEF